LWLLLLLLLLVRQLLGLHLQMAIVVAVVDRSLVNLARIRVGNRGFWLGLAPSARALSLYIKAASFLVLVIS